MGNFRRDNDRGFSRDRGSRGYGGGRDRGRGGFGGRGGDRGRERAPLEMTDVTCAKCGKETQVPFKPKGDKPVYCRDCFDSQPQQSFRGDFGSRNSGVSSGITKEQFNQLNEKLDKILKILEDVEIEEYDEEAEEDEKDSEKEK